MRNLATLLAIGLFFGSVPQVQAADKDAVQKQLKALNGTWKLVSFTRDGTTGKPNGEALTEVYSNGKFKRMRGKRAVVVGTLKITTIEKSYHKQIRKIEKGRYAGRSFKAICKIEGDTRTICVAPMPQENYPKEFTGKNGHRLLVFKRVKKK